MQTYHYQAIHASGALRRGWMPAADVTALAQRLQMQGLELLDAKPKRQHSLWPERLQTPQLIEFCVQLAQLLRAGVPLLQAIETLAEHCESPFLISLWMQLYLAMQAGQPLSQAMRAQPHFPALACHLVAAGEHTGQLPAVLQHLADALQWQVNLTAQTKRGLMYPALLAVMVILAAVVMLTFLVPQMAGFLHSLGQTLPWSTRALIALSTLVVDQGWALFGMLIVMVVSVRVAIMRSPKLRWWWHQQLLQLPVVGQLLQQVLLARLCRFLGMMYRTGIPLLEALELCQPLIAQPVLCHALDSVISQLEAGNTLAQSFTGAGVFPPLMVRMIGIGETTGALDETLSQLSDMYDQAVQARLKTLLGMLEPLLTVLLGGMLMLLMAAVMLPVYESFSHLTF